MGLLPGTSDALHGFISDELTDHFAGTSVSSHEDLQGLQQKIQNVPLEGDSFQPVSKNDVNLAVSHFNTEARGDDEIPQRVTAKALPTIIPHLKSFSMRYLLREYFYVLGRRLESWL